MSTGTAPLPPPPPPPVAPAPAPPSRHMLALTLAVTVAVALAFADSSVVVLALPDLYSEFDVSIVSVAWVVTAYNVAIVAAAAVLVPLVRHLRPVPVAAAGFALFAAASLVCGASGSFDVLVGARGVQGLGAALLLAGSLPLLVGLTAHEPRARSLWALAGTVGAAAGPALGGVLTQLFTWRSIFFVQAPVAAAALLALLSPTVRQGTRDRAGPVRARQLVANMGYVMMFAALVGALFLAVLLVIVVWRYSPIEGAVAVSALPVGALLARPLAVAVPGWLAAASGGLLLGGGLAALALLPDASPAYATPALGACGLGLGLLAGVLGPASMPHGGGLLRPANLTIGARHLGFVLGLVAVAPLLAGNLDAATKEATRASAQVILDGRVGLTTKVPLVLDLRDQILKTPRGRVPNLDAVFAKRGADKKADVATVRDDLTSAIEDTITRAFRPSFALAALFGALATVPALVVALWKEDEPA